MNRNTDARSLRDGLVGSKRWDEGRGVVVQSSFAIAFFALLRLRRRREVSGLGFDNLGWGRDSCSLKLAIG